MAWGAKASTHRRIIWGSSLALELAGMVDELRVSDLSTLSDAAAILHDARFRREDWQFDPETGIFELVCWQLIHDNPRFGQREWVDFRLKFEQVNDVCAMHEREERVPFYEISDLWMASSNRLQILTHYILKIELNLARLCGTVSSIGSRTSAPGTENWGKGDILN